MIWNPLFLLFYIIYLAVGNSIAVQRKYLILNARSRRTMTSCRPLHRRGGADHPPAVIDIDDRFTLHGRDESRGIYDYSRPD